MKILTLIPEAQSYGVINMVIFIIGLSDISNFFYTRYFFDQSISIVGVGAIIRLIIVLYGSLLIPIQTIFSNSWFLELIALPIAMGAAVVTLFLDRTIIRYFIRHGKNNSDIIEKKDQFDFTNIKYFDLGLTSSSRKNDKIMNMKNKLYRFFKTPSMVKYSLFSSVCVAITEEILFRGFLVNLCLMVETDYLRVVLLLTTVIIFGLIHLTLGWQQVLAKSVLGIVALFLRLLFNSVLPAIIVHMAVNSIAYFEIKNKNRIIVSNVNKLVELWK